MRSVAVVLLWLVVIAPLAFSCTGVVIAQDDLVLVGGNEDWVRWDSYLWATAPSAGRAYGVVYFGYEIRGEWGHRYDFWYEFHGINDQGLYFDSFGAPCDFPESTMENPRRGAHLMVDAMEQCSTVEEAVALFESSNLEFMQCQQYLFVDRHGNAAVVEGDHTIWMDGDTFALTNFYLSDPSLGGYPCSRYSKVTAMMKYDATPSVARIAQLLEAASHEGTRYSLICNLTEGIIQVSYAHNFNHLVTLDVEDLCRDGQERISVPDLF